MKMGNLDVQSGVGPQERAYRRVVLFIVRPGGAAPQEGAMGFRTFEAVVPDGMAALRKGDLVEARATTVTNYLRDFALSGEGSAVLKILCPASEVTTTEERQLFMSCAAQLPWYQPWGRQHFFKGIVAAASGTVFQRSLKDHKNLSFSPFYTDNGRPIAGAVAMAQRPLLVNWVATDLHAANTYPKSQVHGSQYEQ